GTTEPTPGTTEPTPGTTEPTPGTTEPTPGTTEPTPGTTEPTPGTTEPTPGTTEPTPEVEMLPEQEVRIVSINLYAGQNNLDVRGELLADLINPLAPDSIGVQECRGGWETTMETRFGDRYARVGLDVNGNHNATSFATYIYYLKDKYIALDTDTFWMSTTPDVPSKYGTTVDMNRTCTWALLENVETGFRYVHMNTHLDWWDMSVNAIQCRMLLEQFKRFEAMGYPVFLTGDHNMQNTTESYAVMSSYSGLADSSVIAAETTDVFTHDVGTIDYCFVTRNTTTVFKYDVLETRTTPVDISDHRGVFVHAKVKSLPRQDVYSDAPKFSENAEASATTAASPTEITVTMSQAKDSNGSVARRYLLDVFDRNGKMLISENVTSGYYLPQQPHSFMCNLSLPNANELYRLRITPVGAFGQLGAPIVQWIATSTADMPPPDPMEIEAPDLINVMVVGGEVKDVSSNAYTPEILGTVTVTGESFAFSNNGNLKFDDFKNHYDTLADGFSMVANFRTGSDVATAQNIISNQHAGGYALQLSGGELHFRVYLNGTYVTARAKISANTDYHAVGVYDPSIGLLLYVDGRLMSIAAVASGATVGLPTVESAKYLCVGADSDATGMGESFYKGSISNAAIYSTPISYANVVYLYQNQ
ncbi:MAG: endonuclease/exonuclease/phosphatase family protein, partial [Clostridia bacterium]|nr:endonuclease/exonuclease/phosphatase family protein [Clostridia bacterium]